jgi:hypothetical protein
VRQDYKAQQAVKVQPDLLEAQDLLDLLVLLELQELLDQRAYKDWKVQLAQLAQQARQEYKVQPDPLDLPVQQVPLD